MSARVPHSSTKYTDEELIKWGEKLIDWCEGPTHWHVSQFEAEHNLPIDFFRNRSRDRGDVLRPLFVRAKQIMGLKVIKHAQEGMGNNWVLKTLVPMYLKDVDEHVWKENKRRIDAVQMAKRAAETEVDQKTDKLLDKLDTFIDAAASKPKAD